MEPVLDMTSFVNDVMKTYIYLSRAIPGVSGSFVIVGFIVLRSYGSPNQNVSQKIT